MQYQVQGLNHSGQWQQVHNVQQTAVPLKHSLLKSFQKVRVLACDNQQCNQIGSQSGIVVNDNWVAMPTNDPLPSVDLPTVDNIGAISAKASVNGGAAAYQIPIKLPPGRAKMQPNIALNYSSSSGVGVAGRGWSVSGLQSISRCDATIAQDGYKAAPDYGTDDRLCLNGQRLVATSGNYGESDTYYRTELDSFVSVRQVNSTNDSASYFVVRYKNGRTAYFGKSAQSKVVHGNKTAAYAWMIEYEHDASGRNFIHYDYVLGGEGEKLIDVISYTGDSAIAKGRNQVEFIYENKRQSSLRYVAGGRLESTKRLAMIKTKVSTTQVNSYALAYENNKANNTELLSSVTLCFASNAYCLPATTINWHNKPIHYDVRKVADRHGNSLAASSDAKYPSDWLPNGDRNGDGVRDWPKHFVDPEGNSKVHDLSMPTCVVRTGMMKAECTSGDFNRDGLTDLWVKNESDKLRLGFGQFNASPRWYNTDISLGEYDTVTNISDFNSDGYDDIVVYRGTDFNGGTAKLHLYLNAQRTGDSTFSESNKHLIHSWSVERSHDHKNAVTFPGDLDSDGTPDIAISEPVEIAFSGGQVFTFELTKALYLEWSGGALVKSEVDIKFGGLSADTSAFSMLFDVNGDGLMDWLGWRNATGADGNLHVAINMGDRTFEMPYSLGKSIATRPMHYWHTYGAEWSIYLIPKFLNGLIPFDVDGDGKAELIMPGKIDTEYCVNVQSKPNTFVEKCGAELYSYYGNGSTSRVNFQPGIDSSIYKYDAYHFVYDKLTGKYAIEVKNTDIVGRAGETFAADGFGKGLTDLMFLYKDEHCTFGPAKCYFKDPVSGSKMTGKGINYVYYNRNSGSVSSASSLSTYQPNAIVESIQDGLGRKASWKLLPLSSSQGGIGSTPHYETDHSYIGDIDNAFHFSSSMYTVSRFEQSNGVGGTSATEYAYKGAVFSADGRGFLGFRSIIEKNIDKGLITQSDYSQQFPRHGKLITQATFRDSDFDYAATLLGNADSETKAISHSEFKWLDNPAHYVSSGKVHHNYLKKHVTTARDINNLQNKLSTRIKEVLEVDAYGNELNVLLTSEDSFNKREKRVENTYVTNADTWWLDKLTSSKTTKYKIKSRHSEDALNLYSHSGSGNELMMFSAGNLGSNFNPIGRGEAVIQKDLDETVSITTNWRDFHASRKPRKYVVSPSSGLGSTVTTTINAYGLPDSITTTAQVANGQYESRKEAFVYTSDGYFVKKHTNAKGFETLSEIDSATGLTKSVKKQIGAGRYITTSFDYDDYQRPYSEKTTGQPAVYSVVLVPDSEAPHTAVMQLTTLSAGKPTIKTYIDQFNRTVRVATQNNEGNWIFVDTQFDSKGNKTHESRPYLSSDLRHDIKYTGFDELGRPKAKETPQYCGPNNIGKMTAEYTYSGLKTDIDVSETCYGMTLNTMSRTYSSDNQLISTQDANGKFTRYAYNSLGLPIVIRDANNNSIVAKYNAMGQKTRVVDPNQGSTFFLYNGFAEPLKETRSNNKEINYTYDSLGRVLTRTVKSEETQVFTYDSAENGYGQLASMSGNGVTHTYYYDSLGRVSSHKVEGDGQSFKTDTFYDANFGRVKGMRYPNGLTLSYEYDDYGFRRVIKNLHTGYSYQKVTKRDVLNNVEQQLLGNSLVDKTFYSAITGQMTGHYTEQGGNNILGIEYTSYDGFGNLKQQEVISGAAGAQHHYSETYHYDQLHRLKSNEIAGITTITYEYDAIGNLTKKSDYASTYDYTSHLAGFSGGGPNAVKRVMKAGTWVGFSYDARGNMTKGDGLVLAQYNAMDKPTLINKNNVTTQFVYGPDNMRFMQIKGDVTTYYAGKHYEVEVEQGKVTQRAYVDDVALISHDSTKGTDIRYFHKDRLGSARLITDHEGNVVVERNFDPFGKPREASGGLKFTARLADKEKAKTLRGFTSHEHLDELELIHMNGRVYDYNLGRFMSVDPVIQSPKNSQSINPYSYIMNNPLAGTDPTGYTGCTASKLDSICENASVHHGGNDNFGNMGAIATQMGDAAMSKATFTTYANLNMNMIKSWMSKQTNEQMDMGSPQSIASGGGNNHTPKPSGSIEPIHGSYYKGLPKYIISNVTLGIIYGNTSRFYFLDASPDDLADIQAFLDSPGVEKYGMIVVGGVQRAATQTIRFATAKGTGLYSKVKGHHVHAKAAFKENLAYDPKNGFSISQQFMKDNGLDHVAMTRYQRQAFKELSVSGAPNNMRAHTRIAVEALQAGGASREMARSLAAQSLDALRKSGVKTPSNIPWYK
ncbi:hypothetical protein PLUTE_b0424 [Pseudoalteromonas luteoviolacea DSM 6061]|nr:hypothetical protein [Pseudoalteromonas luteoviolacea DSM 6061]